MLLIMVVLAGALLSLMCWNKENMKGLYKEFENAQTGAV